MSKKPSEPRLKSLTNVNHPDVLSLANSYSPREERVNAIKGYKPKTTANPPTQVPSALQSGVSKPSGK